MDAYRPQRESNAVTSFSTFATVILMLVALAGLLYGEGVFDALKLTSNSKAKKAMKIYEAPTKTNKFTYVRVLNSEGKLTEPVLVDRVERTEAEWKELLSEEQFRIMRNAGTEPAFCGGLLENKEEGMYVCAGCKLPLFKSTTKFTSGTGWPSFYEPASPENVLEKPDFAHGMVRTEITCARCDSHLGHVFPDGPQEKTGLRYCLNSACLEFHPTAELPKLAEEVPERETAEAILAGGCFWCVEGVFEEIPGVYFVESGYSGGDAKTANYKMVAAGSTEHAEAVRVVYNPSEISYEDIITVHLATHDPTTLNRQGNDVGPQYRSAVFYRNDEEKQAVQKVIDRFEADKAYPNPIVTKLEPFQEFYPAETYHQNFVCRNPLQGYVQAIALPKVEKARKKFSDGVKE